MDAVVWVDQYQLQSGGETFAVGQHVTWPLSKQLNAAALIDVVGAVTAARVSRAVDWHAGSPEDTVRHGGVVARIAHFRCRHAQGHVVPGSVESQVVGRAAGWEPEEDGVHNVGYVVTLRNLSPPLDEH